MISLSDSPACQEYGTMPLSWACIWYDVFKKRRRKERKKRKRANSVSDRTHGARPGFLVLYQLQKKAERYNLIITRHK